MCTAWVLQPRWQLQASFAVRWREAAPPVGVLGWRVRDVRALPIHAASTDMSPSEFTVLVTDALPLTAEVFVGAGPEAAWDLVGAAEAVNATQGLHTALHFTWCVLAIRTADVGRLNELGLVLLMLFSPCPAAPVGDLFSS